jgi:integrase
MEAFVSTFIGGREMTAKRGRRTYGEGSLFYRQSKRLWVARVELEPGDDGGRRRMEKAFKRQRDALEWMAARKGELARYGRTADQTITVADWAERWLTELCAPRLKPASVSAYRTHIDKWIVPAIGRKKLARVTPADVRKVTTRVREAGRSSTTARGAHQTLSQMLEAARREGLLMENAARRVTAPQLQPSSRGSLSADQTRTVLAAAAHRPEGAMLLTIMLTGMRISEVLGLTWGCVDFGQGTLAVEWQMKEGTWAHGCGGTCASAKLAGRCPDRVPVVPDGMPYRLLEKSYMLTPTKTRKPRTVPLLPPLATALRAHRGESGDGRHDLVFHHDGAPIYPPRARQAWRALMADCGIPTDVTPHWARHSVATLLLEVGVDVKVVGEIVGHTSPSITRGTYQHVSSALARDAMTKLGELVAG